MQEIGREAGTAGHRENEKRRNRRRKEGGREEGL